jgi:excisionase family DNA binding protein
MRGGTGTFVPADERVHAGKMRKLRARHRRRLHQNRSKKTLRGKIILPPVTNATICARRFAARGKETCVLATNEAHPKCAAYSIPQAMTVIGIGRDKLYKLIREGKLPARKLGRKTLILATDLEAFLESLPRMGTAT